MIERTGYVSINMHRLYTPRVVNNIAIAIRDGKDTYWPAVAFNSDEEGLMYVSVSTEYFSIFSVHVPSPMFVLE